MHRDQAVKETSGPAQSRSLLAGDGDWKASQEEWLELTGSRSSNGSASRGDRFFLMGNPLPDVSPLPADGAAEPAVPFARAGSLAGSASSSARTGNSGPPSGSACGDACRGPEAWAVESAAWSVNLAARPVGPIVQPVDSAGRSVGSTA
jgi:hypothetical protein